MLGVPTVLLLSVSHATLSLSLLLLPLHPCFTHTHLQEGELSAILQDIAKSRQNIQQSVSGVSTVPHTSRCCSGASPTTGEKLFKKVLWAS